MLKFFVFLAVLNISYGIPVKNVRIKLKSEPLVKQEQLLGLSSEKYDIKDEIKWADSVELGSNVVSLPSLDESELVSHPGPFNIIRVVDYISRTVEKDILDSFNTNLTCSRPCGMEGKLDVMSCLGCIALSHSDLPPIPVAQHNHP